MKNMKFRTLISIIAGGALVLGMQSCKNGDMDFPDYEGGKNVYFAYQNPVRTLVMGEDDYDTTLDNQHKCMIKATMGGSYNGANVVINFVVDNTLCNNLYFDNGDPVLPMPANYYTLSGNTISFNGGMSGGVEVQLTDAFFNDPLALSNHYVIPLVMTGVTGADSILQGRTIIDGEVAQLTNYARWDVAPKDYVLYCVKYISKYDANYIRRGVDKITVSGVTTTNVRHAAYLEKNEVKSDITTLSLNSISYPVTVNVGGVQKSCVLNLTFNANGECTVSSATAGVTASGSGSYRDKSEAKAWGNQDRDGLYLDYQITFDNATVATTDTLVWQSRGVNSEEFSSDYIE